MKGETVNILLFCEIYLNLVLQREFDSLYIRFAKYDTRSNSGT